MLKDFIIATEEEKKEAENWVWQTYGPDILLLILYRIHMLEEKVNRIDEQTKTHWVK